MNRQGNRNLYTPRCVLGTGYLRLRMAAWFTAFAWMLAGCGLFTPPGNASSQTIDPAQDPVQGLVNTGPIQQEGLFGSCKLQPRASYMVQARVLHVRHYDLDWRAVCSPLDLALGWGAVANPEMDEWVQWSQSGRWYFYTINVDGPLSLDEVALRSSNVHIIPATPTLSRSLLALEEGDVILLEGELVDTAVDLFGFRLETPTSLTRTDRGAGACEILYVRRLVVDGQEYR
ncbi:MAG: hypothetical protein JXA25_16950 [Anaerolineales bacterium]|nr:hypothetical protein [Anaerolineales bacterium]